MANETNSTEQALSNLQAIKSGDDPRDTASHPTKLSKVEAEVDRLFEQHEMPDELERSDVHCYIAEWKHKIGNAKYHRYIEPGHYGKKVTGAEHSTGDFALGIAERAFDSNDAWLDTVRHELAHITAFVDSRWGGYGNSPGHGTGWKIEAERLGANPERTGRIAPENRVDYSYFVGCPRGCMKSGKHKRSKRIKQPGRYRCPKCDSYCVSWEAGDERPTNEGTCAVDLS
jgi:predicted SprT family Zn-dependent metalloprotease